MADDVWQDIRDKVEGLGLKLKLHLDQESGENSGTSDTRAALEEMGDKVQDALNGFGSAAKDPAIRADMKDIGVMLRDALTASASNVAGEAERMFKKTKGDLEDDAVDTAGTTPPDTGSSDPS